MNIEADGVKLFIDGKPIGEATMIDAEIDWEVEITPDFNRTHELTLEGTYVNYDRLIGLSLRSQESFKIIAESIKYPRWNKLPKKKRIRNKWIKKYHKLVEYDNVTFSK